MYRYKVGAKVRVKTDLEEGKVYSSKDKVALGCTKSMIKFAGRVCTISKIHNGAYMLQEDDWHYLFAEDMLEAAEMTKAELKDGMIVELGDGDLMLVHKDTLMNMGSYIQLERYNDDLTHCVKSRADLDINGVYTTSALTLKDMFNRKYLTQVWSREPVREMTVSEIEKILGYKVKIVGEDNE